MSALSAVRGDTNVYDITVIRQNEPVPLIGAKLWFTAKSDPKAADSSADIKKNSTDNPTQVFVTSASAGKAQVQLNPIDTISLPNDAYWYDIQVLEQSGMITTIASGVLHIQQDVTRATS